MSLIPQSKIAFSAKNPYRIQRPVTQKILFLAMEGRVTEEEYFYRITELFDEIKNHIQIITIMENAVYTAPRCRTQEQHLELSKSHPKQLLAKMDQFKRNEDQKFQFAKHPDDEFWLIMDVDDHFSPEKIQDWCETLQDCDKKGYRYTISNPFFELWLLLHFDNPIDEDFKYAVTEQHPYEKTSHFRKRLRKLGAPLKDKKHIREMDYTIDGVKVAIERAKKLHKPEEKILPRFLTTTVHLLMQEILDLYDQFNSEQNR